MIEESDEKTFNCLNATQKLSLAERLIHFEGFVVIIEKKCWLFSHQNRQNLSKERFNARNGIRVVFSIFLFALLLYFVAKDPRYYSVDVSHRCLCSLRIYH